MEFVLELENIFRGYQSSIYRLDPLIPKVEIILYFTIFLVRITFSHMRQVELFRL